MSMTRLLILFLFFPIIIFSQLNQTGNGINKPQLVIGIVVDQMRYDYIYRFWDDFGDKGLKRLVNEGHFFRNNRFGYVPTFTGPGHASIFTGTTPSVHGIIANNWYDKNSNEFVYCAGDGTTHTVCNCHNTTEDVVSKEGQMSPHHMLTTTIGDEIKLFNPESKVIGVSLKDRGAILSAGHSANAAYWMDKNGDWITSSFYMNELPNWLIEYQTKNSVLNYMQGSWSVKNKFNHNLDVMLDQKGGGVIKSTPFGNTILKDLAIEIIENEKMGQRSVTDFMAISFSSTDYIGHQYGPHSEEIKDTYLRLDKDIEHLLRVLDYKLGKKNVLVFITADHGVVSEPKELLSRKIPAGYYDKNEMIRDLKLHLRNTYNFPNNNQIDEYISSYSNNQLFLNHDYIKENLTVNIAEVQKECARFMLQYDWIKNTYTAEQLHNAEYQNSFHSLIQRGYNQKRSGDVIVSIQSGWLDSGWEDGGTSHGSSYSYDTHVPLIFWGSDIKKGVTDRLVNIRDIAPTISTLLGVSFPNGCTGNPIVEITQ